MMFTGMITYSVLLRVAINLGLNGWPQMHLLIMHPVMPKLSPAIQQPSWFRWAPKLKNPNELLCRLHPMLKPEKFANPRLLSSPCMLFTSLLPGLATT